MTEAVARILRGEAPAWSEVGATPAAFLEYCEREDLIPLVHHNLHSGWPVEVSAALERAARDAAAREMVRRQEITRVLTLLDEAGIRPIVFKGTALAYLVYPAPGLRPRNDTDLLIRRADVDPARAVFAATGYVEPAYSGDELLFRQFEAQREDSLGVHHAFDVHWEISTQSAFANLLSYDDLANYSVPAPMLGAAARAAGPVEALLIACVHPAMHHRNEERLIWLFDVHLLAGRLAPEEWKRFSATALSRKTGVVCAYALRHAHDLLGTAIPPHIINNLESAAGDEPTAAYLDRSRSWRHEVGANIRGLSSWSDRLGLLREIAFPRPSYILEKYEWKDTLPARLGLPWLYFRRAMEGTWKVVSGKK